MFWLWCPLPFPPQDELYRCAPVIRLDCLDSCCSFKHLSKLLRPPLQSAYKITVNTSVYLRGTAHINTRTRVSIKSFSIRRQEPSLWGKFPGLPFIKRIPEHKRGTRHLRLSEKRFPNSIHLKKTQSVLEKADVKRATDGARVVCIRQRRVVKETTGQRASLFSGMFHMLPSSSCLWTTRFFF